VQGIKAEYDKEIFGDWSQFHAGTGITDYDRIAARKAASVIVERILKGDKPLVWTWWPQRIAMLTYLELHRNLTIALAVEEDKESRGGRRRRAETTEAEPEKEDP
jgi:hypothetical protein